MVAFGHSAVGAVVGIITYQAIGGSYPAAGLILAGALGIVSHYLADTIPHGHFFPHRKFKQVVKFLILTDVLGSVILFILAAIFSHGLSLPVLYVLFGIGGAQLPDVVDGLIYVDILPKTGFLKRENQFHQKTHWHGSGDNGLPWEFKRDIWQIAAAVLGLVLVLSI